MPLEYLGGDQGSATAPSVPTGTLTPLAPVVPPADQQDQGWGPTISRQAGLLGRDVVGAATSIPETLYNVGAGAANLTGTAARALGVPEERTTSYPYADWSNQVADYLGLPRPATSGEMFAHGLASGALSAAAVPGLGAGMRAVGAAGPTADLLMAQPVRQALVGAAQGGAAGGAAALGASPAAQAAIAMGTGAAGMFMPGATTGWANAERMAAAKLANDKFDWNIPPQKAMNTPFYQVTARTPGSGETALNEQLYRKYADTVGDAIGAKPVDGRFSSDALEAARQTAGDVIGDFYQNTPVPLDPNGPVYAAMMKHENNLGMMSDEAARTIQKTNDTIMKTAAANNANPGTIPADWIADQMRAKGTIAQGAGTAGPLQGYYSDLRQALDSELQARSTPDQVAAFNAAKDKYKNVMTVKNVAYNNDGLVPPDQLHAAVRGNVYQNAAFTGGGDLGEAARYGRLFITPPPNWKQMAKGIGLHAGPGSLIGLAIGEHMMAGEPLSTALTTAGLAAAATGGGALAHRSLLRSNQFPPSRGEYLARALLSQPPVGQAPATPSAGIP